MVHVLQNWQQKGMYQCMFVLPYCRLGYVYGIASPVSKGVGRRVSPYRRKNIA